MRVRKAVFPAAGWGTRFLPATKAQPKEMLPLVDKPIIQYAVEEAVAAGIEQLRFERLTAEPREHEVALVAEAAHVALAVAGRGVGDGVERVQELVRGDRGGRDADARSEVDDR